MKYLLPLFMITTLLQAEADISFEDDFLQSLEEVSEIATKAKLNVDDSPSFVTVLHGNKLQELGVNTLFEALGQVPGVQLTREATGVPVVIFRGVSQKGEVKLMLDGVTINNTYRGSVYHYFDFPIELIERVEVIRGAGSILYGSGAISGVINVITKNSKNDTKNSLFISGGKYNNYKGGALVSTHYDDINIAFDAYYQNSDKKMDSNDRHLQDYSVGLKINNEHLTLISRYLRNERGNAYGFIGVPDTQKDKYNNDNDVLFSQLSYQNSIFGKNNLNIILGFHQYRQFGEIAHPSSTVDIIETIYSEDSYFSEIDFTSHFLENNIFLMGAKYESVKDDKSEWKIDGTTTTPIANPDLKRKTSSIYVNDTYTLLSNIDFSTGIRYDHYSDFGSALSPTFALVYRANEKLRLKALYSNAFRAPSWIELTSNVNLEAEHSHSVEAGLIYKFNNSNKLKLNFYKTKIKDLIFKDTTLNQYIQTANAKFIGAEFEYIYLPTNNVELNFFASYLDAEDKDGDALANIANTLATTSLNYKLDSGLTFGSLLKYKSTSTRDKSDTREPMKANFIFDETISYVYKEFTFSLIAKDLFNSKNYYALPMSSTNNDFYDSQRAILIKSSMEF